MALTICAMGSKENTQQEIVSLLSAHNPSTIDQLSKDAIALTKALSSISNSPHGQCSNDKKRNKSSIQSKRKCS